MRIPPGTVAGVGRAAPDGIRKTGQVHASANRYLCCEMKNKPTTTDDCERRIATAVESYSMIFQYIATRFLIESKIFFVFVLS